MEGAFAYLLEDCTVYGCGFAFQSGERFISESKYLNENNEEQRFRNSLRNGSPIDLDADTVWIIGGNGSLKNYWHWIAQNLPAITHCQDWLTASGTPFGLVVPKMTTWQREALHLAGLWTEKMVEVSVFESVRVRKACYSTLLGADHPFLPSIYRRIVRDRMIASVPSRGGSRRVFSSRRDSPRRQLLNEPALFAELEKLGFDLLCPGEMSVAAQVAAFAQADVIVAPHGAGGGNYLFCAHQAHIVELQQASFTNSGPLSLCRTSGTAAWLEVYADDGLGPSTPGWVADIDSLRATLGAISGPCPGCN